MGDANVLSILQDRLRLKQENEKLKEDVQSLQERVKELEKTINEMKTNAPVRDIHTEEIWENNRRITALGSWSHTHLLGTEREQFSDISGHPKTKVMHSTLETNKLLPSGWEWVDDWHVFKGPETDDEGWQYAFNWNTSFSKSSGATSNVRRRKWVRVRRTKL
eukprot:TRINITY_DN1388_c0_g1_i1.p1 TRINITY_DN1388_c0_g1~~TRINITY_DN1388_c0_g1_i1.p1  ORF type:complete len:163 (-),score=8.15 TRINITY_DN1388_c0_g1_i1:173-661(-)